jgi:hypothetical protein
LYRCVFGQRPHHLALATSLQYKLSHPPSLIFVSKLTFHLRLGCTSGPFPCDLPTVVSPYHHLHEFSRIKALCVSKPHFRTYFPKLYFNTITIPLTSRLHEWIFRTKILHALFACQVHIWSVICLINWLTGWNRILPEKLRVAQMVEHEVSLNVHKGSPLNAVLSPN